MITDGLLAFCVVAATVLGSLIGMAVLVITNRVWAAVLVAALWAGATTFVLVASGMA